MFDNSYFIRDGDEFGNEKAQLALEKRNLLKSNIGE